MKLNLILAAAALVGTSIVVQAAPADAAIYGKRLVSTDAVAKSSTGSFDVYIDKQTGFAFVNTPVGWKFTRKVQDDSTALGGAEAGLVAKF